MLPRRDRLRPRERRTRIGLLWRVMDMLGHLNQFVYHELLEKARVVLLTDIATSAGSSFGTWVLVRVELDYRAPHGRRTRRDGRLSRSYDGTPTPGVGFVVRLP